MTLRDQPNVVWDQIKKRYKAYLTMHGDRQFLGYFQSQEDAAMARKTSALHYIEQFR